MVTLAVNTSLIKSVDISCFDMQASFDRIRNQKKFAIGK